jgi:hypothetical protein
MNDVPSFNLLGEWYRSLGVGTDITECVFFLHPWFVRFLSTSDSKP